MSDNRDYIRALMAAYNEEAGLEVSLTPDRVRVLRQLDMRNLNSDDVRAVMKELKRLTNADPRRYPESCLLFANAVAHVDRFEERALMLRKKRSPKTKSATTPAKAKPDPSAAPTVAPEKGAEYLRQWRLQQRGGAS